MSIISIIKRNITLFLLISYVLASCTDTRDNVESLSEEKEKLASENARLNDEMESYMRTFNEIETNLARIKEREENINLNTTDGLEYSIDAREAIVSDIEMIDQLLIENRKKIESLVTQLFYTESEFQKMVARLDKRVKEEDEKFAVMKAELETLNLEKTKLTKTVKTLKASLETIEEFVDTLVNKTNHQQQVINEQTELIEKKDKEMNRGYIAVGSSKELMEKQVIRRAGGFLGLGSTEKLYGDPNKDAFKEINIKEVTVIPLDSDRVELLTPHPSGSYEMALNEEKHLSELRIIDHAQFWNSSKYLVVKLN